MLICAIEFYLSRDEIKESRGRDRRRAARACATETLQDAEKLARSKEWPGFVDEIRHVSFLKGTGEAVQAMIREELGEAEGVELVFSD